MTLTPQTKGKWLWLERDTIIGFGIVAAAIILAVGLQISAAGGGGGSKCTSDKQYQWCLKDKINGGSPKKCKLHWDKCMKKKCDKQGGWPKDVGGGTKGKTCNPDKECQSHCTENMTGNKGVVPPGCCTPLIGPDEKNSCPNKVDSKCVNSKPKPPPSSPPPGGDKGDKKGGDDKKGDDKGGGSPPMPPLPQPPEKDKKQPDPQQDCNANPTGPLCPQSPECKANPPAAGCKPPSVLDRIRSYF